MNVLITCPCGVEFETTETRRAQGRGKFCSKACRYANASRPSGLTYKLTTVNPGAFKPTHGMTGTPTYLSWRSMIGRCSNPESEHWPLYGGRGITVCPAWRDSFEQFLADMGERPEGRTIDRIDPDGNYEPSNCRWATAAEQAQNRRPRTHCRKGHPYDAEHSYVSPQGLRACRVCRAAAAKALREGRAA